MIFTFEKDYDPFVDGCLLAPTIATHNVVTLDSEGNDITGSDRDAILLRPVGAVDGRLRSFWPRAIDGPAL